MTAEASTPQLQGAPPEPGQARGDADFAAEAVVAASASEVFGFLADLENHWLLTGPRVEVLSLTGPPGARDGGSVRIRGPLGLGRISRTEVLEAHPPEWMAGRAEIGRGTAAAVRWTIRPTGTGSHVRLEATVERIAPLDRLALALGGRRVMRKVFAQAIAALAQRFD